MVDGTVGALERAVSGLLAREKKVTPEVIRGLIGAVRAAPIFHVSDEDAEGLARNLETIHAVTMSLGARLVDREYEPWLDGVKADTEFYYWDRYYRLLTEEKRLSASVVGTMNTDSDRTLELLENPAKAGPWNRRGMVVGHVQSGKTAHYIGLMSKAADVGYKLIIVVAGVHNNLRNQTQKRIDEGFVGRDSAALMSKREERTIGVGRFDARRRPVTFTNSVRDFTKETATGVGVPLRNLSEPAVFVVKKNPKTLQNLLDWLGEHKADVPMLLVDDEADNASINVGYVQDRISDINGKLRLLLAMFPRSCYVGYTATPFANIFIDPDTDDEMRGADLFPKHFIVSLDAPSNYFGATKVFGSEASAVVRHVTDHDDTLPQNHKISHIVTALPVSLVTALRTFIVARAIRLSRGQDNQHCSMLVNVSRFKDVQSQVRTLLQATLVGIQKSVRLNGSWQPQGAPVDPEVDALRMVWQDEFADAGQSWEELRERLLAAAAPIKVIEVNSGSPAALNYDEYKDTGLSVVAVGGYSLSRGLTLEGLMVSYFLRSSIMYDTLMQMGRWFGYRAGYEDLCRVWLPEETSEWYAHITEAIEELREEFRTMAAAGATPEEFGLKVRAHPTALIVTARNKMGSGKRIVVQIGLNNRFVETSTLRRDRASLARNTDAVRALVAGMAAVGCPIESAERRLGSYLVGNVPVGLVAQFVGAFANHPQSILTDPGPIGRYIQARARHELATWDVLFVGVSEGDGQLVDTSLGVRIICQTRMAGRKTTTDTLRITNKQRVASRGVERAGVPKELIEAAESEFLRERATSSPASAKVEFPDRIYRARRPRPLLLVHLLAITIAQPGEDDAAPQQDPASPVVTWSISFPRSSIEEQRVEYIVTTTWLRENFQDDLEDSNEEFDSDDD